jgi:hypothetical protein
MKNTILSLAFIGLAFSSCQKDVKAFKEILNPKGTTSQNNFVKYTIKTGEQYCDLNAIAKGEYSELKFTAKFDSSAIYKTIVPSNQGDINKLFGFSDNNMQHHQFSARFGWNWDNSKLNLFAYTYNNGVREHKLLGSVALGAEANCSIKVIGDKYVFTLNSTVVEMPRASTTPKGVGYKLYPYFGGDELAPHEIRIFIKEVQAL